MHLKITVMNKKTYSSILVNLCAKYDFRSQIRCPTSNFDIVNGSTKLIIKILKYLPNIQFWPCLNAASRKDQVNSNCVGQF